MDRSVLFFDIDGTLLSEITYEIPWSALEALNKARKAGHLLFINTGRTFCSLPPKVRQFGFDGYLCGCGTYLTYGDEVLLSSSIPEGRGLSIISKMAECRIEGMAEGVEDVYMPSRISRFDGLESTRRYFRGYGLGVEVYLETGKFTYDKFLIYTDKQSDKNTFMKFIEEDIEPIDRGNGIYECVQKGYSKATACDYILNKFGMDLEQAYVFGDSTNDISMFAYARHTIAMGEHAKELEPYTEYVTDTVEEDGLAHAIEHYGLI